MREQDGDKQKQYLTSILNKGFAHGKLIYFITLIIIVIIDMWAFSFYETWSAPVIIFIFQYFILLLISKALEIPNDINKFIIDIINAFGRNNPLGRNNENEQKPGEKNPAK